MNKILLNLPLLILSSSISSYQLIQLIAINLYALFHSRRRGALAAGSAVEAAEENISHQNGDGTPSENSASPTTSAQHILYDKLMFTFTGL